MTSKLLIFWLAMMLLAGGGLVVWYGMNLAQDPQVVSGQEEVIDYGEPVDHFQLIQSTGDRFDSHSLDGKVWIASFFWAKCPHECRDMNEAKKRLVAEFGHRGVKFVSITCDAETDTPAKLTEEVQRFHADTDTWFFLTGNQQYIEKVGANIFKVHVEPKGHSPHLIVVDRDGEKRGYFNFKNPVEMENLRALVNELLANKPVEDPPEEEPPAASTDQAEPGDETESATLSFKIEPFVGAHPILLGMQRLEVHKLLGPPEGSRVWDDGHTTEYWHKAGVHVGYKDDDTVKHVVLSPGRHDLSLGDVPLWSVDDPSDPNHELLRNDSAPVESVGILIYPKLGISTGGFHTGDKSQRSLTVAPAGTWDEITKDAQIPDLSQYQAQTQ